MLWNAQELRLLKQLSKNIKLLVYNDWLTLTTLKLEEQKELETLVVQAVNDKNTSLLGKSLTYEVFNLSSIVAKLKFKELDERE